MRALVFQLAGPLAAFGDIAVGERRGSFDRPTKSGALGLAAAALGIDRADEAAHAALADGCKLAVATLAPGRALADFHTAQSASVAALNRLRKAGRRVSTRADELAADKLETILSRRVYRIGALHLVALVAQGESPLDLDALACALRRPAFTLYLGRKSCPPALPLAPDVVEARDVEGLFAAWLALQSDARQELLRLFGGSARQQEHALRLSYAVETGLPVASNDGVRRTRRDAPLSRVRRQFDLRTEVWFEGAPS